MKTIRKTKVKRQGNKITLILPENFTASEVDVLIWPSIPGNENSDDQKISDDLLEWPEMSDEELNFIMEKRNKLNEWK